MKKYLLITFVLTLLISCESELSNPDDSGLFIKLGSSVTQNQIMLIEVDTQGNTVWQKILTEGLGMSVKKTDDGGYIVLGSQAQENNFDFDDFVLIKTNDIGDTIWTKNYGNESLDEQAVSVDILEDGGYIMLGNITYTDSSSEMWILRTDAEGNVIFDKRYGLIAQTNTVSNILVLNNGDIVSCGTLTQTDGSTDIRVVLADERGNLKWDKIIQLPGNQTGTDIKILGNSFILTGITNHETNGGDDIFLAKISNLSAIEWTTVLGSTANDGAFSVYPARDGFAILGYSSDTMGEEENTDVFFVNNGIRPLVEIMMMRESQSFKQVIMIMHYFLLSILKIMIWQA